MARRSQIEEQVLRYTRTHCAHALGANIDLRKHLAQLKSNELSSFRERQSSQPDKKEFEFINTVLGLLFEVYCLSMDQKFLSRMEAYKHLPLRHPQTCKSCLETAQEKKLIRIENSKVGRRQLVKPGDDLEQFMLKHLESVLHIALQIAHYASSPLEAERNKPKGEYF